MDDLATELTRFGDTDGPGGSTEDVIDLANRLEAYIPFFFSLSQERLEQVLTTYGPQLEETANRVATLALATDEVTGSKRITSALQRTPVFAIDLTVDSSDNRPPPPTVEKAGAVSTITEESFNTLLTEEDVRGVLTTEVVLTTRFFDYKAGAEGVDPTQVEKMDSWYGLSFDAAGRNKGITFSAIDFDSAPSAQDHFEKIKSETPGMQEMVPSIGDASIEVEVNAQGIGSMLVFINGDKLVSLHTAQPDDQDPLVSLAGLEELAALVASRPQVSSVVGLEQAAEVVVATPEIPEWLFDHIQRLENEPVTDPPASITQYEYQGRTVYFLPQRCCDIFSDLYDADGEIIGHPDGGITGRGDGRVPDFFEDRNDERVIWKDPRTNAPGLAQVTAPIESVEVLILESFPPQYRVAVISGLPNACVLFGGYRLDREDDAIRIEVVNWKPTDPETVCDQEYSTMATTIPLGPDFESGKPYSVVVNEVTETFVAQ